MSRGQDRSPSPQDEDRLCTRNVVFPLVFINVITSKTPDHRKVHEVNNLKCHI